MLRMQFTTRNTLQPDSQILMQLIEGPFSHLVGQWDFTAIGDRGSSIRFRIEFEFSNRLAAAASAPVFKSLCDSIVDAFVLRAQKVHRQGAPRVKPLDSPVIQVEVAYALPRHAIVKTFRLAAPATVADALRMRGLRSRVLGVSTLLGLRWASSAHLPGRTRC